MPLRKSLLGPFTPCIDQAIISPHNTNTISRGQMMRIKKNIDWKFFSWSNTNFSEWILEEMYQTVRRITSKILGVIGLRQLERLLTP